SCLPRAFSPLFFAVSLVPFLLSPCSKELELYGYKRMLRRNLSHTFSLSLSRQEEKSAPLHRKIIPQLTRCTQKHDNYRAHPSPDGLDGRRVDANKQRTHCMSVRRLLAGTLGTERPPTMVCQVLVPDMNVSAIPKVPPKHIASLRPSVGIPHPISHYQANIHHVRFPRT
ncbi:hypothetical protein PoMZ_00597, partial [Pyricularia oryzae]